MCRPHTEEKRCEILENERMDGSDGHSDKSYAVQYTNYTECEQSEQSIRENKFVEKRWIGYIYFLGNLKNLNNIYLVSIFIELNWLLGTLFDLLRLSFNLIFSRQNKERKTTIYTFMHIDLYIYGSVAYNL